MFEERLLNVDNLLSDAVEGIAPLDHRLHQPDGTPELTQYVVTYDGVFGFATQQCQRLLGHTERRQRVLVDTNVVLAFHFVHSHVRHHVLRPGAAEAASGIRVQVADVRQALLHLLDGAVHLLGDLGQAVVAQVVQVMGDQTLFEGNVVAMPRQLQQQALAHIPRADTRRIEPLDQFQRQPRLFLGHLVVHQRLPHTAFVAVEEIHQRDAQEAGLVERPDDHFGEDL